MKEENPSISSVCFSLTESYAPKASSSTQRLTSENGLSSAVKAPPPPKLEKPKRHAAARGVEDVRPSVESLLTELETSVPMSV